ncbi:MAG: hypothetical protein KGM49_00625 [Sphingomonadales bacterium]|nr:hypothetical protein [Sphingomonadales bacterium]
MNNRTLTSADCILLLAVNPIFPVAQRIQGFSADDVFDTEPVQTGETSMGVDGRLSAGYTPVPVPMNISLQADSLSNDFFEFWADYERGTGQKLVATGTVLLPATKRQYAMTRGFLRMVPLTPSAKKILQPRRYTVEWERVSPAPQF